MGTLHLEVNDAYTTRAIAAGGGWRRVMSFADGVVTRRAVMSNAEYLLECSDSPRIRARIIAPGDTAPLVTWTAADGWKEWRA